MFNYYLTVLFTNVSETNVNNHLSKAGLAAFFTIGFLCLFFLFAVIFLYVKKVKRERKQKAGFAVKEQKTVYQVFYFWSHVSYLVASFALLVAALVLLGIAFGSL